MAGEGCIGSFLFDCERWRDPDRFIANSRSFILFHGGNGYFFGVRIVDGWGLFVIGILIVVVKGILIYLFIQALGLIILR